MGKMVAFTVPKSGGIYQLDVADTLVGFLEYDFTYFWEQCLELAHKSRLTGEYYAEYSTTLKEYIRTCHPYYDVLIRSDFDKIVLDCIIDFIFRSENVGLEELWVRYISAKDSFGREVFARISEYKTGSAINQWANLLRMQEYAAAKAAFLFDGEPASPSEYYARKQYYDLAFSLTARELGYSSEELPQVRRCPAGLLPDAPETIARATKMILPVVKPFAIEKRGRSRHRRSGCMQDQAGGLVFNAMAELRRPEPVEMEAAADIFREMPSEIFVPSCFKAVLDLEFDKMLEEKLILRRGPDGKGYVIAGNFGRNAPVAAQIPVQQPPAEDVHEFTPPTLETEAPAETAPSGSDEPVVSSEAESTSSVVYPVQGGFPPEAALSAQGAPVPSEGKSTPAPAQVKAAPAAEGKSTPAPAQVKAAPAEVKSTPAPAQVKAAPAPAESKDTSRPELVQKISRDTTHAKTVKKAQQNINVRCQLVYTALYSCVTNKTMSEREFEEWSHQLMGIRRSIIKREMSVDDLERYLDATEEIYPQIVQSLEQ